VDIVEKLEEVCGNSVKSVGKILVKNKNCKNWEWGDGEILDF